MKYFGDIGINNELVQILKSRGFVHPTKIQEEAIPLILEGKDLIGQAETGSGKTAACGIPLIQRVDKSINDVQILVLTPTRELAMQYLNETSSFAIPYGVTPFVVYGGFDKDIQLAKLRSGVQILVATPGRITDIIYNDYFPVSNVRTLVIDEADEMMKMGFIEDVDFIKNCLIQEHQTLFFSATMPPPIKKLAKKYLKDAVHIRLNEEQVQPDTLAHAFVNVSRRDKKQALKELVKRESMEQALIFCNTRSRVSSLFRDSRDSIEGLEFLHGGLDQNIRSRIVEKFRRKKIKFLITTDVMARGMDIGGVSHIINYDVPDNPEIYIHRSGRTARLGREGVSISFVSPEDRQEFARIKEKAGIEPDCIEIHLPGGGDGHKGGGSRHRRYRRR
ncbi:MAG: DEAD/DEAH box helicase [Elusimicrobia bacterium]|nr:DEAD/DEAH box helicase [Elusimicrobiota bacterium]